MNYFCLTGSGFEGRGNISLPAKIALSPPEINCRFSRLSYMKYLLLF